MKAPGAHLGHEGSENEEFLSGCISLTQEQEQEQVRVFETLNLEMIIVMY